LVEEWRPETSAEQIASAIAGRESAIDLAAMNRLGEHVRFSTERAGLRDLLGGLMTKPVLAVEGASQLLSGRERAQFLGQLAAVMAGHDAERALTFGAGLEGAERADFLKGLAAGWAGKEGEAAWNWSLSEPDASLRAALQAAVLDSWAVKDPAAAAAQLSQITGKDARDALLSQIAAQWGSADTRAAFAWAETLSNVEERNRALAAIREQAPVGIGAVLAQDNNGYPVIREVVPGSALSKAPGIAAGSQIAAVRDESGRFIDTKDRELSDILPMLRGSPGTMVALQIIPPGGSSANRRTVVVTRAQLLFKRPDPVP
jgi:hypothetical protein